MHQDGTAFHFYWPCAGAAATVPGDHGLGNCAALPAGQVHRIPHGQHPSPGLVLAGYGQAQESDPGAAGAAAAVEALQPQGTSADA